MAGINVSDDIESIALSDIGDSSERDIAEVYSKTPEDSGENLVWEQPE